ncbi:MAG: hypothetical protein Q9210_005248 [Variospora velana]
MASIETRISSNWLGSQYGHQPYLRLFPERQDPIELVVFLPSSFLDHPHYSFGRQQLPRLIHMQGIWTRIAKFPCSRNGSACFSSAAVIARRSTAAPIRRRIARDDAFAVFFSTVVLASTVADGKRRSARQQECVREINHARSELNALKADQERRLSSLAPAIRPGSDSHHEEPIEASPQSWQDLFEWAGEETKERNALGFNNWRGVPLDVLKSAPRHQIEDFLDHHSYLIPIFAGAVGPEAWETVTWPLHIKKIRTLEWANAKLTLKLMRHVPAAYSDRFLLDESEATEDVRSQLSISSSSDFRSRLDHIQHQLDRLEDGRKSDVFYRHFESPKLPKYSVNQADDPSATDRLNAKLYALFASRPKTPDRITNLLPNICAYLLASKSPPTIHTYNLLLLEFAGEQRNDLIPYVLRLIIRTHLRINEVTLVEALRYFLRTRQCSRFDQFVASMDGFRDGLGEAPPWLDIPDLLGSRYRVRVMRRQANNEAIAEYFDYTDLKRCDLTAMKRHAKVKIYEKSRRNLEVYQILIEGALSFHGMSEAMRHYRTMISEGWSPNEEILLTILHGCVVNGDWDAGFATWKCLQGLGATISERGYLMMLQLCQMVNQPRFINELLQHGIQRGVLPKTALEMGWHKPPHYQKTHVLLGQLERAKDVQDMSQKLEELLGQHQGAHEASHENTERIDVLVDHIKRSLPYPCDKSLALLLEAESFSVRNRNYSLIDAMLRESSEQILSVTDQLDAVRLFKRVQQLELQLQVLSAAMTRMMKDASSIFFSACLTNLQDCFDRVFAGVALLGRDVATVSIYFNIETLQARFYSICQGSRATRWELSSLVPSFLGSIGGRLSKRANNSEFRIQRRPREMRLTLDSVYEERVAFRQLGSRGYNHDRFDTIQQPSHRPSETIEYNPDLPLGMSREVAAGATDAHSTSRQSQRQGLVRFHGGVKGKSKSEFRKLLVKGERTEESRVKRYGGVRLDSSQIGAAQSQHNASDRLPPITVKASDRNGSPQLWLPKEASKWADNRACTQTHAAGNVPSPCPNLANGLRSLSATHQLEYG